MRKLGQILLIIGSTMVLLCSTLAARNLTAGVGAAGSNVAQFPTRTPGEITPTQLTPSGTASPTATSTATGTPTQTPTGTFTPTPSNTPTGTPSGTPSSTPTATWTNTPVIPPPSVVPPHTPHPTDVQPKPKPECQSRVEGRVLNAAGQPVTGATVTIQGEGWSRGIMTDNQGRYGFGGLCAGSAVLQAFFPDGQTSQAVSVSLTGQNSIQVDLGPAPAGTSVPTATSQQTAGPTAYPTAQPTSGSEAEMPETGFSGWLLAGGAALAALLLLTAGARRTLRLRERGNSQDS